MMMSSPNIVVLYYFYQICYLTTHNHYNNKSYPDSDNILITIIVYFDYHNY